MVLDIQIGLTAKNIPLEGRIIRVADEFDAIVSKRQYKSHVGICETLDILLKETRKGVSNKDSKKSESEDVSSNSKKASKIFKFSKEDNVSNLSKIEPKVFKALVKTVIEDTEYEISCLIDYIKYLKDNMKRLEKIISYKPSFDAITDINKKKDFLKGMSLLFETGENFDNCSQILSEYDAALTLRNAELNKLFGELKKIKKMA